MKTHSVRIAGGLWVLLVAAPTLAAAQGLRPIELPKPQTDGGRPLMQVLKDRRTSRAFSPQPLPAQMLSNLLWAAFGVNRPESGKRTAPSAMNWQEVDIYVATADGFYVYDAKGHRLDPILAEDVRAATGRQEFVKDAPVSLVYVADMAKVRLPGSEQMIFVAADTGFISQNVYLFCASEGLATGVRGSVDHAVLAKVMKLRPEQKIILAQSVGYPKK